MKKFYLIAAAAAAVLAAGCAKNEVIQTQGPGDAVSFGVYVPKTVTKAGAAGTMTLNTEGTTKLTTTGFGVFATYSDGGSYASTTGPNFMYNQQVTYATDHWTYSPTKYWPNETIHDSNNAHGPAAADKLSFFAYAPYVATAGGGWGINDLTDNDAHTDPKVTYVISTDPSQHVDLIWAVAPAGGFKYTDVYGATVTVDPGKPLINLTKPSITTTIPFHFLHATARLGFKIVGAFDRVTAGGTLDAATKVTVKQVEVVDLPIKTQGDLNLNNTDANTPLWEFGDGGNEGTLTLLVEGDNLNSTIKDSGVDEKQTQPGVIASEKNLMADNKFFTLIPRGASTDVKVKITYYVTTEDAKLDGGISRVENVIYKTITFGSGFEAGKAYTIRIILGLTSVKLEADVEPWDVLTVTDVDLPKNKECNNSFDLASTASVTLVEGAGTTADAVWSTADGTVSIYGPIIKDAVDFDNSSNVIALTGDRKISFTGASAGVYVIPLKAAGDATHDPVTKTITVTVTGS
jgi:hypothetical protein